MLSVCRGISIFCPRRVANDLFTLIKVFVYYCVLCYFDCTSLQIGQSSFFTAIKINMRFTWIVLDFVDCLYLKFSRTCNNIIIILLCILD